MPKAATVPASLPAGLIRLLALMCGVSIASAYYSQPLLGEIGRAFNMSEQLAGAIPMFTQLGIALGALLFLPLGDIVDDRKLILGMVASHVGALVLVTLAPDTPTLLGAMVLMGLTTVTPYLLPAYAAKLAGPAQRGQVAGLLAQGSFAGILLARTASGFVGHHLGWSTIYWIASAAMIVLGLVLARRMPGIRQQARLGYAALLGSLLAIFRAQPELRRAAARQGLVFGAFNAFWISLVFLLEGPAFNLGSDTAGLFGVIGFAGALAAPLFGKLADRRGARFAVRAGTGMATASWLVFAGWGDSLAGLAAGVLLLDLGVTASDVSNQAIIYRLGEDIRGRVTTIYILGLFIGGGTMAGLSALSWSSFGWHGVCALGALACALAFALGASPRRQEGLE
ncbi:hypothetical protein B0920_04665 [Massilia sp. KIM]|nr:hypothetical protein B0920_04665 [Massilia sp. KIM]